MADKADWSDFYLRNLIDVCKAEIDGGNRPNGIYSNTGWKNLELNFAEKTGDKRTRKQLKNKLDGMKKKYTMFMEFKNSATGLGWNEAKQTIKCSQEWWDEHLARCNNPEKGIKCNHVKFRKQGPKYLDDLHTLFGKVHVTGASASCPGDISSDESSGDNVAVLAPDEVKLAALRKSNNGKKKRKGAPIDTVEKEDKSPFVRLFKNTCLNIDKAAEKISSSVEASSAPPPTAVPTIAEAMKMVKDCGVQEKTGLMHTATFLIMKPEFREVLCLLETNEGRLDLIQREHDRRE